MSSWLSLSLPNPFKSPDDHSPPQSPPTPAAAADLSVLTQSITRQLRGVASFLAPPPNPHSDEPPSPSSSKTLTGIKNDLAEIGDSFKTSLSLLSNNKAVSKISKLASNLLQFENQQDGDDDDEEDYEDAVGITDEVINFVGEISRRPELWTDFPLSLNKDFGMSDVQKDHTLAIEQLVPSLTALRHKIDGYLNKEQFWIIYFVLLLPRLNEDDSKLLTTPEIVEVRETLLQKLKSKHNTPVEVSSSKLTSDHLNAPERTVLEDVENSEPSSSEEEEDVNTTRSKRSENEDDISFSDLENQGNSPSKSNDVFSQSGSSEWVQLKEKSGIAERKKWRSSVQEKDSESEGSNDWLTVDKTDSDYD